jgi:hypothetical protein
VLKMTRDFSWTVSSIAHLPAAACTISAPGSESPPGRGGGAEHRVGRVLFVFAVVSKRLCGIAAARHRRIDSLYAGSNRCTTTLADRLAEHTTTHRRTPPSLVPKPPQTYALSPPALRPIDSQGPSSRFAPPRERSAARCTLLLF